MKHRILSLLFSDSQSPLSSARALIALAVFSPDSVIHSAKSKARVRSACSYKQRSGGAPRDLRALAPSCQPRGCYVGAALQTRRLRPAVAGTESARACAGRRAQSRRAAWKTSNGPPHPRARGVGSGGGGSQSTRGERNGQSRALHSQGAAPWGPSPRAPTAPRHCRHGGRPLIRELHIFAHPGDGRKGPVAQVKKGSHSLGTVPLVRVADRREGARGAAQNFRAHPPWPPAPLHAAASRKAFFATTSSSVTARLYFKILSNLYDALLRTFTLQ